MDPLLLDEVTDLAPPPWTSVVAWEHGPEPLRTRFALAGAALTALALGIVAGFVTALLLSRQAPELTMMSIRFAQQAGLVAGAECGSESLAK